MNKTVDGLELLRIIGASEIEHLDSKLIGSISVLAPEVLKEALDRVLASEARKRAEKDQERASRDTDRHGARS